MVFNAGKVNKDGVIKVKVGDTYKEECPLDKKARKELADYEHSAAVKVLDASREEAVKMMMADDNVIDIQFTTPFGVHTYGSMTVRVMKARKTRSPARGDIPAKENIAPNVSMKLKHGVVGRKVLIEQSESLDKDLK